MHTIQKLTVKNLLMNKTRTLMTIIGIILSATLITMVACTALSARETVVNIEAQTYGNWTVGFWGDMDGKQLEQFKLNRSVDDLYATYYVGNAKIPSPKYDDVTYIAVTAVSEGGLENCFNATLKEGRYPQNASELVLPKNFVKSTKNTYKLGDTITLELGVRTMSIPEEEKEYAQTDNISFNWPYDFGDLTFEPKFKKTYTIVGFLDNISDAIDSHSQDTLRYVYTGFDIDNHKEQVGLQDFNGTMNYPVMSFIRLTPEAEQDYMGGIADILGIGDKALVDMYLHTDSPAAHETVGNILEEKHIAQLTINEAILKAKLIIVSLETAFTLATVLVVLFGIIIISSIFIIRNSFYISISEKSKLYGMLTSIGATPRQIRNNVFFEGFLLGLIAIPIGIVLGIFGTAGLVSLCNGVLGAFLGGIQIQFAVSWLPVAMALVLCVGTIFMSVLSPAIETARISPIVAIRGNQDVKIAKRKRKKAKAYKTPKLIQKLFGIGGSIAWKNLQRSKKKYRATVISIAASVTVYLAASTIIGCLVSYLDTYHEDMHYNMYYSAASTGDFGTKEYVKRSLRQFDEIADRDEVTEAVYAASAMSYIAPISKEQWVFDGDTYGILADEGEREGVLSPIFNITTVDKGTFQKICESLGKTESEMNGKAILVNFKILEEQQFDEKGDFSGWKEVPKVIFKNIEGTVLNLQSRYAYFYDEWKKMDEEFEFDMEQYGKIFPITIGAEITPDTMNVLDSYQTIWNMDSCIIVDSDWLMENIESLDSFYGSYVNLYSTDSDATEAALEDMGITSIDNAAKEVAAVNAVSFIVQFFVYSFIGMITLIGLTNVFNTIHTNMNLRQKEFAALRSIGMTNAEFDRMITLESFFYTSKALFIGLPLGLLLGYGAYRLLLQSSQVVTYTFPWIPLLLTIAAVALVIWLIMVVSIRKIRSQNIIETIRNDNI